MDLNVRTRLIRHLFGFRRPRLVGLIWLLGAGSLAMGLGVPDTAAFGAGTTGVTARLPQVSRPAAAQNPTNRATFGIQPSAATKPDSRSYFDFGANPGGVVLDHVAVINYSLRPLTLHVKASDALITDAGGFALQPPNHPTTELGTWVHIPRADAIFTVPPRSYKIIPFTVQIPSNANPGDHAGGILATLQSLVESKSGQKVKLLQSVGARIFLRVSGPLNPGLTVENLRVRYTNPVSPLERGRAKISYTVVNTGNVDLGGRQSVWVSGLFGTKKYAAKVPEVQLLLPGFSVRESAVVSGILPELSETAHVSIAPLIVPGSVQPKSGPFTATKGFWAIPWVLLAAIALVSGVVVWLMRRRGRRRNQARGLGKPDASPAPTARTARPNGSGSPKPQPATAGATANASVETVSPQETRNES